MCNKYHVKCCFQCKNQTLLHLLSFDLVLNKYLSWQIKLPLHGFALLYSVDLSARGWVVCALVMWETLPDNHSHHYDVKTDLGCRIYMCSLNIISQILCIQQDNLCCHTSRVTCTLMSISNSDIINTNELSSLIHTKPFPCKKACPNNDCHRYFIFEWLGRHLLTLHHIDWKEKSPLRIHHYFGVARKGTARCFRSIIYVSVTRWDRKLKHQFRN